jgi:hypothetical protein
MAKIQRSDMQNISPVYDLNRAGQLEELDELAGQGLDAAQLQELEMAPVEHLLGLREVAPQAASLSPPPSSETTLQVMTGPQVRGFFRRMVLNYKLNHSQVMEQLKPREDDQEVRGVTNRLQHVTSMINQLDEMLRNQDDILGRLAGEQKA